MWPFFCWWGDFLLSIDLKHAYLHVPICFSFLHFSIGYHFGMFPLLASLVPLSPSCWLLKIYNVAEFCLLLNFNKPSLVLTACLEYLGLILGPAQFKVFLPQVVSSASVCRCWVLWSLPSRQSQIHVGWEVTGHPIAYLCPVTGSNKHSFVFQECPFSLVGQRPGDDVWPSPGWDAEFGGVERIYFVSGYRFTFLLSTQSTIWEWKTGE